MYTSEGDKKKHKFQKIESKILKDKNINFLQDMFGERKMHSIIYKRSFGSLYY